ncbi:hypothetical protein HZH66_003453 [Vespula vulgaris]|uniref:Uncharacterized protein n=1 Tax=Vespula vulgaris TaxID=7454 RepID=A0A834KEQ9_VESVU|nr:hypothetical protein HZH66_003453 [Vespula vulgaris]
MHRSTERGFALALAHFGSPLLAYRWLPAVNWHPSDPLLALSDCEWSEMITRDLSGSLVVQDLETVREAAFSSLGCSSPVLSTNCSACMDLNIEER